MASVAFTAALFENVSIVTGGTRSVGEGIATALARAGRYRHPNRARDF